MSRRHHDRHRHDADAAPTEAAEFRQRCRDFLAEHAHAGRAPRPRRPARRSRPQLAEAGLAGLAFADRVRRRRAHARARARSGARSQGNYPMMTGEFIISHGMCLPMLNEYGTDEQKAQFLRRQHLRPHDVVPDVLRARRRLRRRQPADRRPSATATSGSSTVRRCGPRSPTSRDYGIVIARTDPDQAEARRHLDVHRRHEGARRRDPPDPPDRRRHATSTRCSSPTSGSRRTGLIGELNNGWRWPRRCSCTSGSRSARRGAGKISQPTYKLLLAGGRGRPARSTTRSCATS